MTDNNSEDKQFNPTEDASTEDDRLAEVLKYAREGLRIFPVKVAPDSATGKNEKKPRIKEWPERATTDEATLADWWRKWPDAQPGWAIPEDTVVIDIDKKSGVDGYAEFERLNGAGVESIWTPQASSPSGGRHLIFNTNGRGYKNSAGKIAPGIDVRAEGGFVVLPTAENGRTWIKPLNRTRRDAPHWLRPEAAPEGPPVEIRPYQGFDDHRALRQLDAAYAAIKQAVPGSRNVTLHDQACSIGGLIGYGLLDRATTEVALLAAIKAGNYTDPKKDRETLLRGLEWGIKHPRHLTPIDAELAKLQELVAKTAPPDWLAKYSGDRGKGYSPRAEDGWGERYSPYDLDKGYERVPEYKPGAAAPSDERDASPPLAKKKPVSQYAAALQAIDKLGLRCRHDVFHDRKIVEGDLPENLGSDLSDAIARAVRETIIHKFKFDPKKENVLEALERSCEKSRFDPVCDYLGGLVWDGRRRLDDWLVTYFGAEATPLNQAFGRKTLIAAVRRARQPGVKFDTMLILEGAQNIGKSRAVEALAGRENFSDQGIDWHDERAQQEALAGVWIHEVAELQGLRRADVDSVKRFLSRTTDRVRPAYGRFRVDKPRRGILIGTFNPREDGGYLLDETGNRRFWPVRVKFADVERLVNDRDQLWAEAAGAEAAGEKIFIEGETHQQATAAQEERMVVDPWEDVLNQELRFTNRASTDRIMREHLKLSSAQMTRETTRRIGAVMRKLGWEGPTAVRFTPQEQKEGEGRELAKGYRRKTPAPEPPI